MLMYKCSIPIKIISEGNNFEHWTKKYKRKKKLQKWIWAYLNRDKPNIQPPCFIKLKRVAPRSLDYDNLVTSLKYVVDEICAYIHPNLAPGQADSDKSISFLYEQEKGAIKTYALQIEVYKR